MIRLFYRRTPATRILSLLLRSSQSILNQFYAVNNGAPKCKDCCLCNITGNSTEEFWADSHARFTAMVRCITMAGLDLDIGFGSAKLLDLHHFRGLLLIVMACCFSSEIDGSSTRLFYTADGMHPSPVSHVEEGFDMVTHDETETAPDMDKLTRNHFGRFGFYSQILTKSNCGIY